MAILRRYLNPKTLHVGAKPARKAAHHSARAELSRRRLRRPALDNLIVERLFNDRDSNKRIGSF